MDVLTFIFFINSCAFGSHLNLLVNFCSIYSHKREQFLSRRAPPSCTSWTAVVHLMDHRTRPSSLLLFPLAFAFSLTLAAISLFLSRFHLQISPNFFSLITLLLSFSLSVQAIHSSTLFFLIPV